MFTIRTRYACVLSLLVGAFAVNAQGAVSQEGGLVADSVAVDSLSTGAMTADSAKVTNVTTTKAKELVGVHMSKGTNTEDPFNARLQKRYLGSTELFKQEKWTRHFNLSVFSGATLHGSPSSVGSKANTFDYGLPIGASASYQWHALHSVRLMYVHNTFRSNDRAVGNLKIHEAGVGYMFNLTNYFKGYNPNKRFHTSLTGTAFLTHVEDGAKRNRLSARGEVGLLFDYRLPKTPISVFIEPYFGLSTDDYDRVFTPHRYDWLGGVRGGLSLSTTSLQDFADHVKEARLMDDPNFKKAPWFQHFYFGSSYGRMWSNTYKIPGLGNKMVDSHLYLGYRFTPVHSLRFQATYYKTPEALERKHHVMGELDYQINFTNMWRGFDPNRHFRVAGFLGVGGRYLPTGASWNHYTKERLAPMVIGGLDFHYYVTPNISFFLEPYVGNAFPVGKGTKNTVFYGARGGFQVDLYPSHIYMPHYAITDEDQDVAYQWKSRPITHFYYGTSLGIRGVHTQVGENHRTMPFNFFLGYRFTPVQSLRLQFSYIKTYENLLRRKHTAAELDYMVNFTNLFYGYKGDADNNYKNERRLNVSGYVGVDTKNLVYKNSTGKNALMYTTGALVRYRFYKGLSVFAEPYAALSYQSKQRYYVFDYGINGGLVMNLDEINVYGERARGYLPSDWSRKFWRHMFVGGSGGIMGVHTLKEKNRITTPMNMFVGYRFTPNQALRLKGSYIRTMENVDRKHHVQGEIDYMLNVTNMFLDYNPKRLLNVFTYWGIGAKYLDTFDGDRDGKLSPMATMGLDVALRIKRGLSVFAEPYLAVAKGKGQGFYTMYYGANLGLALNFEDVYAYNPHWGNPDTHWLDQKPKDHFFFGASAGWMRTQFQRDHNTIPLTLFAGYRFSPIHALRLKASFNRTKIASKSRQYLTGGVDFMFNLSNMLSGYKPNRPINLIGFVGLGLRDTNPSVKAFSDTKMRLMGNAGLDIAYRLTRNVNIFVEPYVGAVHSNSSTAFVNYFMGINGGLVVNLEDLSQPYRNDKNPTNHRPFFEAAYGWMMPLGTGAGMHGTGLSLDARAGVWIDPIFGIRGSLVAENYTYSKHYHTQAALAAKNSTGYANSMIVKFRVEGMLNLLNLISDRRQHPDDYKFDLNLAGGLEIGGMGKKYALGMNQDRFGMYGATVALQALYKVSNTTSIFIEPRYERMNSFHTRSNAARFNHAIKDDIMTLSAGLRLARGTKEQRESERRLNFEQTMFIGVTGGGYKAIAAYKANDKGGRLGGFANFSLGFLISPLHGVKVAFQPSWYSVKVREWNTGKSKFGLMDYRALYMLNFSNLYQGEARRKVDAYLEGGIALSTLRSVPAGMKKKVAAGPAFGFLIAFNLNKHWAITTEPMGQLIFKKGFLPGYGIKPRMARMRADLSIGTMWKF